ncbi:MAG: hypothetical protein LBV23_01815 [Deltaproteobacteria bacterium]|nr:hypothetical protein [Deltaproteobacteria bacterium]
MKIIPFKPNLSQAQNQKKAPNIRNDPAASFQEQLDHFSTPQSNKAVDKITAANKTAYQGSAPKDVEAAGGLLLDLVDQIKNSPPSELLKIHNLDGVLYYYLT